MLAWFSAGPFVREWSPARDIGYSALMAVSILSALRRLTHR